MTTNWTIHRLALGINDLARALARAVGNDYKVGPKKDYWGFTPGYADTIIPALTKAYKEGARTFLDVGCGVGNVLLIASSLDYEAYGLELDKNLIECSPVSECIRETDALKYRSYHKHDFVYMYQPIRNRELQTRLERRVENALKVGAYYLCLAKVDTKIDLDSRFKSMGIPGFWKKEKD